MPRWWSSSAERPPVPGLAEEGHRLAGGGKRPSVVARAQREHRQPVQRPRAHAPTARARHASASSSQRAPSVRSPRSCQNRHSAAASRSATSGSARSAVRSAQRSSSASRASRRRASGLVDRGLELLGQPQVVRAVARLERSALAGLGRALARVMADGVEQAVARDAVVLLDDDERLVDEPAEHVEIALAHGLHGVEVEAAGERAEPAEQRALVVVEQLVAPVERGGERLLASQRGAARPRRARSATRAGARRSAPAPARRRAPPPARSPAESRPPAGRSRPPRRRSPPLSAKRDETPRGPLDEQPRCLGRRTATGTRQSTSPAVCSGSRLVASTSGSGRRRAGPRRAGRRRRPGARSCRARSASAARRRAPPPPPRTGARNGSRRRAPPPPHAGPGLRRRARRARPARRRRPTSRRSAAAASSARRVLPQPPGPVSVSKRWRRASPMTSRSSRFAPDEARELERQVACPPRRAGSARRAAGAGSAGPRRRPASGVQDVLVEAAGLVVGLVLELAPQRLAQQVELGQRALAAAGEGVDAHQLAVRPLVQRLGEQRLLERGDRGRRVAGLLVAGARDRRAARGGAPAAPPAARSPTSSKRSSGSSSPP